MDSKPRLVLLPGLGADARFLDRQREAFADLVCPAWLDPEPREKLGHYAKRLAASVRGPGPCVVGGISLGGMVALEMARHMDARAVVLISSCRSAQAVNPLLRWAERSSRLLPDALITFMHHAGPSVLGRGGAMSADDTRLLVRMAQETPIGFLRWGARACLEWPGLEDPGVPVHHIHGGRDWAIPAVRVRPTRLISDGVHVLNMSHPREVNEFIGGAMARASA